VDDSTRRVDGDQDDHGDHGDHGDQDDHGDHGDGPRQPSDSDERQPFEAAPARRSSDSRRRLANRYELLGSLGRGGMADVQRARDRELDREVAVKILHARYAHDPEFLSRFQREARSAANLNHPHIVAVYDTGEDDHRPYIVMELVEGRSLKEVLQQERVTPEAALHIVGDASLALHYAHERGLVHRDVKPANILISDSGSVKVTDFGIARAVDAETVTQTAAVFGTAAYMAPEQARSEDVDRRTDVYALGCVLYELLAGRAPFSADSPVALAHKHISEMPPPPSSYAPSVTDDLDAIALKALAKEPADRYQTARELNADLQRALEGHPVTATVPAVSSEPTRAAEVSPDRTRVAPAARSEPDYAYEYEDEREPRRAGRGVAYALLVLAVIGAVVLIGWYLSTFVNETGPAMVTVPDLTEQTESAARAQLEELGLRAVLGEREFNPDIARDLVIDTDPEQGMRVEEDTQVILTLSDGPEQTTVPEIEGLTEDEARELLRDEGLTPGERSTQSSDDVDEGRVIRSVPGPGSQVDVDSVVDLVISTGGNDIAMPDVVGVSEARAIRELESSCETDNPPCLTVSVSRQFDADVPQGVVISQSPEADTPVEPGSSVVIVVSRGPEEVPTTEPPEPTPTPAPPEPTPEPTPTPTPTPPEPSPEPTS
jgi:serine/threonine-protein kinase